MERVSFSPKKNHPWVKVVSLVLCLMSIVFFVTMWALYLTQSAKLMPTILATALMISFSVLTINVWNYEITFVDHQLIISNWIGKKRVYLLENLRKEGHQYLEDNYTLIVLFDELHAKNVLLRYSDQALLTFLESIGFQFNSKR